MKSIIAGMVLTMIIATAAQAGFGPFIEDVLVEDLGGGITAVSGSFWPIAVPQFIEIYI